MAIFLKFNNQFEDRIGIVTQTIQIKIKIIIYLISNLSLKNIIKYHHYIIIYNNHNKFNLA